MLDVGVKKESLSLCEDGSLVIEDLLGSPGSPSIFQSEFLRRSRTGNMPLKKYRILCRGSDNSLAFMALRWLVEEYEPADSSLR